MLVTTTDSDSVDEMRIEDVWDGKSPSNHRPLSCCWTGEGGDSLDQSTDPSIVRWIDRPIVRPFVRSPA